MSGLIPDRPSDGFGRPGRVFGSPEDAFSGNGISSGLPLPSPDKKTRKVIFEVCVGYLWVVWNICGSMVGSFLESVLNCF